LCRRDLEGMLNDDLFKMRLGSTDSELFFLLMIQNGLEENPVGAIRATIGQITEAAAAKGAVDPFVLTICLSDGQTIYTCRHATSGTPPSLFWQYSGPNVLVASEPLDGELAFWTEVAADSILVIGHEVTFETLFDGRTSEKTDVAGGRAA